jgi:hypothetical protein
VDEHDDKENLSRGRRRKKKKKNMKIGKSETHASHLFTKARVVNGGTVVGVLPFIAAGAGIIV